VSEQPDFRELVGEELPPDEERRLRRAHELMLQAGPLPELPPGLATPSTERPRERRRESADGVGVFQLLPRRRVGAALALAAAIALVAFFGGYLAGYRHNGFTAQVTVPMHATAGASGAADIKVGKRDDHGNWPLEVDLRGLPALKNGGYYEMYLTRGKRRWTCGTFASGGAKNVSVRLNVPYTLERGDGWIVTEEHLGSTHPGRTVLTT
jgi:hypothetical protein